MSEESSENSLKKDVLDELGDDKLQEIAGLLGTDAAGAQDVVGTTVTELSGNLREKAEDPAEAEEVEQALAEASPPQGISGISGIAGFGGFGGLAAGGMLSGVLAKMSRPVANAVAKKTGLPAASVTRVIELLIPVVLTVLTKRAGAAGASGGGGGLGGLLGQVLGGKRK